MRTEWALLIGVGLPVAGGVAVFSAPSIYSMRAIITVL